MNPSAIDDTALNALRRSWPGAFRAERTPQWFRETARSAAQELAADRSALIDELFSEMDNEPPGHVWSPPAAMSASPQLGFLHGYWHDRRSGDSLPLSEEIDAGDLVPALGYLMLMEPVGDDSDFRYRVYGSRIVDYSKIEMTGKRVWDIPAPWVATYFAATYQAVCRRREPLYAHHRARLDHFFAEWERLILPFTDRTGRINRLLVGNVPSLNR